MESKVKSSRLTQKQLQRTLTEATFRTELTKVVSFKRSMQSEKIFFFFQFDYNKFKKNILISFLFLPIINVTV